MTEKLGYAIAIIALASLLEAAYAAESIEPLSDPKGWNGDFMRGAQPTATCPTDTIANVKKRMGVRGPLTIEEYEKIIHSISTRLSGDEIDTTELLKLDPAELEKLDHVRVSYNSVSDFVRDNIGENDAIYDVWFSSGTASGSYWGFNGYVVARDECVIHVSEMGYDN